MPSGDFSRPPADRKPRKPLRKKTKTIVRKTTAPVTDAQSSGTGYGVKKAEKFKQTKQYGTAISKAAVAGVRMDQTRKAAKDAKTGKPFSPSLVAHAISLGLTDAKDLRVGPAGRIEKNEVPLDEKRGGVLDLDNFTKADWDRSLQKSGLDAAGQKLIDQTLRPSRAVMGVADELVKGHGLKGAVHGFTEGLVENKPYSAGKILKRAGVPKEIAGPVGFVADVATDPTTYATFGAGSVAKRAALKTETRTFKRATKAGMTQAGARQVARRAGEAAALGSSTGKGLTVKLAGKEVPAVRRVTAKAGSGVGKAAGKAPKRVRRAAAGAKDAVREVRPQLRPADTPEAQFLEVRQAGRKARASARLGIDEATQRARGLADRLNARDYERVIDAIERGKIRTLPPELHQVAVFLRDEFRHAKRLRREAGIPEGTIRNYFPHARKDRLEGEGVVDLAPVPPKGPRTVKGPARRIKKTLSEANAAERARTGEDLFSSNVPLVFQNYGRQTAVNVARARLFRDLADAGERIPIRIKDGKRTATVRALKPGEAVYHVGPDAGRFGIREIDPGQVGKLGGPAKAGQYVILNKRLVDQQLQGITQAARGAIGTGVDRLTSGFKRVATFTPGFHARNIVGDTQMAYLAQPGHVLPRNVSQSGKALRRLSEIERSQRKNLGRVKPTRQTIKIRGTRVGLDEFLKDAREHGVVRSGYIGRELEELKGVGKNARRVTKGTTEKAKRWMQNREDLIRLATYKHGLDKGLTPAQAADLSLNIHIDYGDLTAFERSFARRAFPFYTFSARALPVHAKALVQRPGKFAQFGKLQQEAALATGLDFEKERGNLKTFQARQLPLILNINGQKTVLSDALPMTLLNELPASTDLGAYVNELAQWVGQLTNPIFKDPVELYANRSFFFRNDIQPNDYPLVAAPAWVKLLHDHAPGLAASLGVTPDYIDRKTGKRTWGWNGKADYVFKTLPGIPLFAQKITQQGNRRGQSEGQQWLSFLGGVRAEPLDPDGALTELLFEEHDALESEIGALRQQKRTARNAKQAARLRSRQRAIERQLYELSKKKGDAIPLYRPPARGGSGPSLGSGLSSGLGG